MTRAGDQLTKQYSSYRSVTLVLSLSLLFQVGQQCQLPEGCQGREPGEGSGIPEDWRRHQHLQPGTTQSWQILQGLCE